MKPGLSVRFLCCLTICPQMRQSISCGRDDGELPIRDVRLESTCARGSHACYDACAVMVGMFFSYLDIFIFPLLGVQR